MDNNYNALLANLLIILQSFEKYWMINYLSKGSLFKDEVSEEAGQLHALLEKVTSRENKSSDTVIPELKLVIIKDFIERRDTTNRLITDTESNYRLFRDLMVRTQTEICSQLKIEVTPKYVNPMIDGISNQRLSEWLGQVHPAMIEMMDGAFADSMTAADTIAIVADIRRSQDLMTYSAPDIYSSKIIEFIGAVKDIILTNHGVFDKFTGDGFIAYFNQYMCESVGADYYNQMWMTCIRIMEYANSFFDEWSKHLRKIPEEKIGLSIGIDSGKILFTILVHQVFAVGEPCVWATRMSSAGHSGEVIFNNIPYNHILDCHLGLNFQEEQAMTKTGEKFKCHKVVI